LRRADGDPQSLHRRLRQGRPILRNHPIIAGTCPARSAACPSASADLSLVGDLGGVEQSLGACPKCQSPVYEHGSSYVCEKSTGPHATCDFKSGKIILQQPVAREQMSKLLHGGKTDLLENFVSNKTRRKFKAYLSFDKKEGKVGFEFEPRAARPAGAPRSPTR
jgi:hypothetical protein